MLSYQIKQELYPFITRIYSIRKLLNITPTRIDQELYISREV